jgi:hypothetical protein
MPDKSENTSTGTVQAVEDALPSKEEGSRRTVVSAAVDLADRLVTMQHEFLRSVRENVDNAVQKRGEKQK